MIRVLQYKNFNNNYLSQNRYTLIMPEGIFTKGKIETVKTCGFLRNLEKHSALIGQFIVTSEESLVLLLSSPNNDLLRRLAKALLPSWVGHIVYVCGISPTPPPPRQPVTPSSESGKGGRGGGRCSSRLIFMPPTALMITMRKTQRSASSSLYILVQWGRRRRPPCSYHNS